MDFYDILTLKAIKKANDVNTSKMTAINTNHIFADNTARDAYFTTNPTEKVAGVIISVGVGYQEWTGSAWISKTGIVASVASGINIDDAKSIYIATNVEDALQEVKEELDTQTVNVGTMANLTTTEKTNLVGAINEIDAKKAEDISIDDTEELLDATDVEGAIEEIATDLAAHKLDYANVKYPAQVAVDADYTLVLTDVGKLIVVSDSDPAADITITIPKNSVVAFPVNTEIMVVRYTDAKDVIIAAVDVDVTIISSGGNKKINDKYEAVTLKKMAEDTWLIIGSLKV